MDVLRLWKRDYNSKFVLPLPRAIREAEHSPWYETSSFDKFLLVDDLDSFDASSPIKRYDDYCGIHLTSFLKCLDVVVWWESCDIKKEPISQIGWDIIAIAVISSKYKRVFTSAGPLITPLWNQLKEDIIKVSKYLSTWYKQESASLIKGEWKSRSWEGGDSKSGAIEIE